MRVPSIMPSTWFLRRRTKACGQPRFSTGSQVALRTVQSRSRMLPAVDELVGRSAGTATAELDRRDDGLAHAPTPPPTTVSPPGRAREHAGPVRRMVLAATAGGLVGAVVASGALLLQGDY